MDMFRHSNNSFMPSFCFTALTYNHTSPPTLFPTMFCASSRPEKTTWLHRNKPY